MAPPANTHSPQRRRARGRSFTAAAFWAALSALWPSGAALAEPSPASAGLGAVDVRSTSAEGAQLAGPADLPEPEEEPEPPRRNDGYFPFNLSFLYPIAINAGRPEVRTNVDIAILVGHVGSVTGFQTGVLTYTAHEMDGLQASVAAIAGGDAAGLQVGAAFAFADGRLTGGQVAGLLGWSSKELRGVQLSGIAGQAFEDVHGLQLSGGVSIARKVVTGVQAAGLVNIGRVRGLQLGLFNVSAEVEGLQIGLFNVARKIDGLQVGLVNITDSLSGESFGLANILRPGAIHLSVWGSNSLNGNAGLKFASKYAYSILSAALRNEDRKAAFGAGLTLGLLVPLEVSVPGVSLNADLGGYRMFSDGFSFSAHDEVIKTRLLVAYELAQRFSLFLGGGAYMTIRGDEDVAASFGPEISGGVDF